jgi:hypothetical protein
MVDHVRALGLPAVIRRGLRRPCSKFLPGSERGDPCACIVLDLWRSDLGGDSGPCATAAAWAPFSVLEEHVEHTERET